MAGEILKLAASIKDAIAEILAVLPGAFRKANGVQQCATFRCDGVLRCGLLGGVCRGDGVGGGVRRPLRFQSLSHRAVLLIAFAGALGLQALSQGKCQPHADGAKPEHFRRSLGNGVNPLGESMQQPEKLQAKESPPSSMAWLDGEGPDCSLDGLPLICLGTKAQWNLGTGLARPA